jgi:WD40 repeat protein
MYTFIRDAHQFIVHNKFIIKHAPLQLYVSVLVFCPSQNKIGSLFQHERPILITQSPVMEEEWHECHTKPIESIAYSPNSMKFVSASDDFIIRLWDTDRGMTLAKFQELSLDPLLRLRPIAPFGSGIRKLQNLINLVASLLSQRHVNCFFLS